MSDWMGRVAEGPWSDSDSGFTAPSYVTFPGEWLGACVGEDADTFFAPEETVEKFPYAKAAIICGRCEVREECLLYALEAPEKFGYWGGATPEERRKMRKDKAVVNELRLRVKGQ